MGTWLTEHGLPVEYHAASLREVDGRIREQIGNYLRDFDQHRAKGHGLLLTGTVGVGKTYILALVMKQAYSGWAHFCYCQDLFDVLIPKTEEQKTKLWRLETDEVLCLDGFGEAWEHDWPYSKFELFVEKRKAARKVTCLSTNLSMKDLRGNSRYARVVDRLKTCCYPFELDGASRRKALDTNDLNEKVEA